MTLDDLFNNQFSLNIVYLHENEIKNFFSVLNEIFYHKRLTVNAFEIISKTAILFFDVSYDMPSGIFFENMLLAFPIPVQFLKLHVFLILWFRKLSGINISI